MNTCINPVERSKQLDLLSRENHYCLLFVWKLRQGLRNQTPVDTLRDFCSWYWKNHIKPLFDQEEKILGPYLLIDDGLAIQLNEEHNDIRSLILDIDADPDTMIIALLANSLDHHIRFEERILFPHLERKLSTGQLNTISRQLGEQKVCPTVWKEEFWTGKTS